MIPLLVNFLAGAALVLAFAPFGQGWLAPLALALGFHLWLRAGSSAAAFWRGLAFGLGLNGFGLFWLHHSIAQFGGLNLPFAILITLVFATFMALFPAVLAWAGRRCFGGLPRWRAMLGLAAGWVALEWLRSGLFTGFTWLSLGYSQTDTPLAGYAPVLGVYGVSLAVVLSAVALAGRRQLWLLLPLWGGGWALQQPDWVKKAGPSMSVALVQASIPQHLKWRADQFRPTLELYTRLTQGHPDARLVIWPETAVPAFADQVEHSFLQPLHQRFETARRDLLLGIPVRHADGRYYNALINLGASGRQSYYKRHLVPFGEYMPFAAWLRPLINYLAIPMSEFSAGSESAPLMRLAGHRVGLSICYEDTFAEEVRQGLPEAAFLVNVSNDAWFGDSLAPHQHLQMARMRAQENRRYLLRATNTGISAIIDEQGRLNDVLPQFESGVLSGQVQPLRGETAFVRWGQWPVLLLLGLFLGLACIRRAR